MALQIVYNSEHGVALGSAYVRVESVAVELPLVDPPFLTVRLRIWADAVARTSGKCPLASVDIAVSDAHYTAWVNACVKGAHPINVIYAWLKTQSMFSGAQDV